MGTEGRDYAERLLSKQSVWWKRALNVQAPYQWNLRRQGLGRTLDVGCGLGRHLETLPSGSLGVDHNPTSVEIARELGHDAMTVEEFTASDRAQEGAFDSLLFAHVIEHLERDAAVELVRYYLPFLRFGGKVMFICPQERGYASDATHVHFCDGPELQSVARDAGLEPGEWWSFPFPRRAGRAFTYNEFCLVSRRPGLPLEAGSAVDSGSD